MTPSPDLAILRYLASCTTAAACRLSPGELRSRLAYLESLRHVASRTDTRLVPPARAFTITGEGQRRVERR